MNSPTLFFKSLIQTFEITSLYCSAPLKFQFYLHGLHQNRLRPHKTSALNKTLSAFQLHILILTNGITSKANTAGI